MSLESTKYQPIPSTTSIRDPLIRASLDAIKHNVELLTNQRTNLTDYSAVLYKDFNTTKGSIINMIQLLEEVMIALSCIG